MYSALQFDPLDMAIADIDLDGRPDIVNSWSSSPAGYSVRPNTSPRVGSFVVSVMYSMGVIGRPETSVPAWSPLSAVAPIAGLRTEPEFEVSGLIG